MKIKRKFDLERMFGKIPKQSIRVPFFKDEVFGQNFYLVYGGDARKVEEHEGRMRVIRNSRGYALCCKVGTSSVRYG